MYDTFHCPLKHGKFHIDVNFENENSRHRWCATLNVWDPHLPISFGHRLESRPFEFLSRAKCMSFHMGLVSIVFCMFKSLEFYLLEQSKAFIKQNSVGTAMGRIGPNPWGHLPCIIPSLWQDNEKTKECEVGLAMKRISSVSNACSVILKICGFHISWGRCCMHLKY